jgi:LuxR family maltose regulon positive regulatory protein
MEAEAPFTPHEPGINKTPNGEGLLFWLEIPRITYCRVLLAEGSDAGLQEAEKKLQECLLLCQDQHNTLQMIGIMVLQALALQKQGRTDEALAVLEEAVDLARPGGFIRPFVESGPTVEGLLKRLAEKNIALDYIGQLLAAFPPTPHPRSSIAQPLDEHLTNRELQILDKTMQLLTNKEIGANLCIAPGTVKTHLKNIYRKLNVNTRRQAIVKANTLGILSSVDQRISGHRSKPTPL